MPSRLATAVSQGNPKLLDQVRDVIRRKQVQHSNRASLYLLARKSFSSRAEDYLPYLNALHLRAVFAD